MNDASDLILLSFTSIFFLLLLFSSIQHLEGNVTNPVDNENPQCLDTNRASVLPSSVVSADMRSLSDEFVKNFAERNYKFISGKQNYNKTVHPIRQESKFDWADVDASVRAGGHKFCSFIRDNYACYGRLYEAVLRKYQPIDPAKVSLGQLKPNSFVFIQGNSYLAEVIYYWTCYDDDTRVWFLKGIANSIFAYNERSQSAMLLIDNDPPVEKNPMETICKLQWMGLFPSVIMIGKVNYGGPLVDQRTHIYARAFPDAITLEMVENQFLPRDCPEHRCNAARDGQTSLHQCIPGPMVRVVEDVHKKIENASYAYVAGQRSAGIIRIQSYRVPQQEKEAIAFAEAFSKSPQMYGI